MEQNIWHICSNDIYGVNGLLNFSSKEALILFLNEEFVLFSRLPDVARNEEKRNKIIANFSDGTIECVALGEQLLTFVEENEGELDLLQIEDFESLRTGKSEFSKMTILAFWEIEGHDPCVSISKEMEGQFREFFVNVDNVWVG